MPDQENALADDPAHAPSDLSSELASSLASVWARYAGSRPTGGAVEVDGSVVRWSLPQGLADLRAGLEAAPDDSDGLPRTMSGYRRASSAAVSKVTRRRVSAYISKEDSKTGAGTETFILEAISKKY